MNIVRIILEHGADIHVLDGCDHTLLHAVCSSSCGTIGVARFLFEHSVEITVKNNEGETALDKAVALPGDRPNRDYIIEYFREHYPEEYFTKFCTTSTSPGGR